MYQEGIIELYNVLPMELQLKNEKIHKNDFLKKTDLFGFYFAAYDVPQCRIFNPELVRRYMAIKQVEPTFELFFASTDKKEEDYNAFYEEMPWGTLGFNAPLKNILGYVHHVVGVPAILIFNYDSKLIDENGRGTMLTSSPDECIKIWKAKMGK